MIPRSSPRTERKDSDTFRVGVGKPVNFTRHVPGADEWGCVKVENIDGQAGYPTVNPLADWKNRNDYVFPESRTDHRKAPIDITDSHGEPLGPSFL